MNKHWETRAVPSSSVGLFGRFLRWLVKDKYYLLMDLWPRPSSQTKGNLSRSIYIIILLLLRLIPAMDMLQLRGGYCVWNWILTRQRCYSNYGASIPNRIALKGIFQNYTKRRLAMRVISGVYCIGSLEAQVGIQFKWITVVSVLANCINKHLFNAPKKNTIPRNSVCISEEL